MVRYASRCFLVGCFAGLLALTGCGGSSNTTSTPTPQVSVSVSPTTVTLIAGGTQTFTATVSNDSTNAGVSWSATTGAITSGGVYTAPSPVTSGIATITATSKVDATKSASATVTLTNVVLSIAPASPAAMGAGGTQAFTATITGDSSNAGVRWSATGGGSFSVTTTQSGVATSYTAPSPVTGSNLTVTATSVTYPALSATVTVPLTPITVSLTSPSTATLDGDGVQSLTIAASLTGDSSASGATFTISGAGGTMSANPVAGNTPSSTYTAPAVTSATSATVTVASVKDPTKIQAVAVTLNPPMTFTTAASLPTASLGALYSGTTIAVAGGTGAKTFALKSGSLPAGLAMSAAGVISGTPTGTTGLSTFTVSATDQASSPATVSATFTLSVGIVQVLSFAPSSITVGSPDTTVTLTGTGFTPTAVVYIYGTPLPTTFLSSTSVSATLSAGYFNYTSSISLTVRSGGYTANTVTLPVVNPTPVLTAISPSSVIAGSSGFLLTVTASGITSNSTVVVNGISHSIFTSTATTASISIAAQEVAAIGSLAVTAVNPTPGGGSSASLPLQVIGADNRVRSLAYSANDVATDPVRNLLYASVNSSSTTSPNSLIAIDPVQGTVVTTQTVSGQPNKMAITDDGGYLYVSFPDTGEVRRYTLPALTADIHWTLPSQGVVDLRTAPGLPHTIAVTSGSIGSSIEDVRIYDDGVARTNALQGSYASISYDTLAWGADAGTLYGTNAVGSGGPEYVMSVGPSGLTLTGNHPSAFGDFVRRLQFDKKTGLLFEGYGRAVDPATGNLAGQFNLRNTISYEQNPFTVDSKHGRAFFLNANYFGSQSLSGSEIQAFDVSTYTYINTLLVPGLSGSRVEPWGASGLAIVGGTKIYIIDGPFVTQGATPSPIGGYAAPSPTLTALSLQNVQAGSVSVDVVVTGKDFTQAALATWNGRTLSTTWQSSTQVTVTFPASQLAKAAASALTIANGPGQENSNGINFTVLPALGANVQISALDVSGEDMVWDSTRQLLYVAVTNPSTLSGNTIAVVDPSNASLRNTIYTGSQPSVIAISDDNHYLYTGFQTSATVQRYLLPDFTLDLTIPLNSGIAAESFAGDIKVAPGQNQTIAVSMGNHVIEPRDAGGLAIFDNAVRRANVLPYSYGDTYKLAWGKDSTRLYANSDPEITPQSFSILSADGTGITGRVAGGGGSIGLRPHYDAATNLVYNDGGRITNPADATAAGVFESYGLMVPDPALNRAFFLRTNASTGIYSLDIFDLRRQAYLKSISISGIAGYPTQLVRWGDQGLALLTDDQTTGNGGLYLLQGSDISGLASPVANGITLSPSNVLVGAAAGTVVTVTGTNFLPTSTIQVNGQPRAATSISPTQLSFALTAADQANPTYLSITVTSSSAVGATTPAATLEIDNPAPTIATIAPVALLVGSQDTTVTLTGTGFMPSTVVFVNGSARTSTYISSTKISVVVSSYDLVAVGSIALTAVTPAPGGGTSAAVSLPINNPVPAISSFGPSSIAAGSAATSVSVFGSGFLPGTVIQVNGTPRVTTYSNSSQIRFTLTAADVASTGSVSFKAVNPAPGGGSSAAASIPVNNAQLGPVTLSPNVVLVGATPPAIITVNGSNFLPGATVQISGARTVTYVSSTQLTFQLTTADQATAKTLNVLISNPQPGGGSAVATLTVSAATSTPVITTVSPTQFFRGSTQNYLQVQGSGFSANSVINWNGSTLNGSSFFSAGSLYTSLPDSLLASSGTANITVSTPSSNPSLSNSVSVTIVDPPAPTLTSISPTFGPFHTATAITLTGTNFTNNSILSINGLAIPFTLTTATQLTTTVPPEQLAAGNNLLTVTTPGPGGGTSASQVFTAYVPIANNGMVYNPANQMIYLSVPSSAGAPYGNSIVPMDPATGALGSPIFVGSEPNQMAITSDGTALWVGLDGASAVRKVDLIAHTAGFQFPLPVVSSSPLRATALIAVPGQPDSVAVAAISSQTTGFATASLGVYDSGVARGTPVTLANAYSILSLQIDGTRNELYAALPTEYRVYTYNSSGLTLKTDYFSPSTLTGSVTDRIQLYSGRMYTDYSSAFDAETGVSVGGFPRATQYSYFAPLALDPAAGFVYLLNSSVQYSSTPNQIQLAKLSDFSATGTIIPVNVASNAYGLLSPVSSLTRWGADGLAFRTGLAIYPLRSNLVKDLSTSPADLGVTVSTSGPAATGAQQTYVATVTNAGTSAASEVTFTATIPSGGVLVSVVPSSGTCSLGSVVTCSLGALASGASATITLTVTELTAGSSTLSVQVTASQPDPSVANNQASSTITITGSNVTPAPTLFAISPSSILTGSTDTVVTATGQNFAAGATLLADGVALPTTLVSATQLTATIPSSSLATLGWHQITVSNPTPGGGTTSALTLSVFSVIKAGANHILYEPFSRRIYATLGSGMPLGNSVEAIDPVTGALSTPIFVGSEPTRMALSDDGQTLYTIASAANHVVRFNTLTQATEASFALQSPFPMDNSSNADLDVQPGSENTIALNSGQIVDFDPVAHTSTARSSVLTNGLLSPRFLDASDLLGYANNAFARYAVTSTGIGSTPLSYFAGDSSPFKLAKGLAYVNNGTVVDVTTQPNRALGTFSFIRAYYGSTSLYFAPDPALGRAFFLLHSDGVSTYSVAAPTGVIAYDTSTFLPTAYIAFNIAAIEPSTSNPAAVDVIRWGQDGIAALTNSGNIYLTRGPAIMPQLLQTNTPPTLISTVSVAPAHGSGNTVLTLSGSNFLPGVSVTWNGSYRTTILIDGTHVAVDIPASDLVSPGTVSLAATNPGSAASAAITINIP